jgi:hypothetical protein
MLIVAVGVGETVCILADQVEVLDEAVYRNVRPEDFVVHAPEEPPALGNFGVGSAVQVEEQRGTYTLDAEAGAFGLTGMAATLAT